jgi:hypothetical protein
MAGSRKLEIEARYLRENLRFADDAVLVYAEPINGSKALAMDAGWQPAWNPHQNYLTIKGDFAPDELKAGQAYRFYGSWNKYTNKRSGTTTLQFVASSHVQIVAHDEAGIVAYLESAGRGHGVGLATAKKAWQRWESDAVRVIRDNPRKLLELNRNLTDEQLAAIQKNLFEAKATEDATIELTNLLTGRGFPKKLPRQLIKAFGNAASRKIRKDWALLGWPGCGFKKCDAFYSELGYKPSRLKRQAMAAAHAIASDTAGDTWHPVEKIERAVREAIGRNANPQRAIEFCLRLGKLAPGHYGAIDSVRTNGMRGNLSEYGDRVWLAQSRLSRQEQSLARMVVDALAEDKPQHLVEYETFERVELSIADHVRCHRCSRQLTAPEVHVLAGRPYGPTCIGYVAGEGGSVEVHPLDDWLESNPTVKRYIEQRPAGLRELPAYSLWPEVEQLGLTQHQIGQLSHSLVGRVAILGGSPGTGKTYSVAQVVRALISDGRVSLDDIAVGAPTGKAAVRVTENLVANQINLRARTWHSLLGAGVDKETGEFGFAFGEGCKWPYKVIIGDEMSMQDISLMRAVFAARPRGCHFLLVGDINQLPPVGPGAPLRDMIAAGVPYGELTEIMRNSGGIVEACAAIRDGRPFMAGDNFQVLPAYTEDQQLSELLDQLERAKESGLDPVWDCQVLVAVNAKSELSRAAANKYLQPELNQNPAIAGSPFRLADKIICTQNDYYSLRDPAAIGSVDSELVDEQGRVYVANGELGKVLDIKEKRMFVQLWAPDRIIVVPRGKADSKSDDSESDDAGGTGCNFDLAYAITSHKSQGSEWPWVLAMIDEHGGAKRICDRSWLYTVISRAREYCGLIGQESTAQAMCRKSHVAKRKTFLREWILRLKAERVLEGV